MKTSFISSYAVSQSVRYQITRMQSELVKAETEIVTGRVADTGLHLGARTGQSVYLEREIDRLGTIIDTNNVVSSRLSTTQKGLDSLTELAKKYLSNMTAASSVDPTVVRDEARTTITSMIGVLNTNVNGENIFAGVNTDVRPINDFMAPGSTARAAMEQAFEDHFGFALTDPQAADVGADAMTQFLTDVIEPQFMGAEWKANWSNASDETITSRITLTDTTQASVSANADGVRRLAMSAAVVDVFFGGELNVAARNATTDFAGGVVGQAVSDLAQTQAQVGIIEQRVKSANERLGMQVDIFKGKTSDMVGVDPYEASSRISLMLAQIETSYTLTSRMRQLSLVRYLP